MITPEHPPKEEEKPRGTKTERKTHAQSRLTHFRIYSTLLLNLSLYVPSIFIGTHQGRSGSGRVLTPPRETIGTNRTEYYLPHELVLIGCGKRIASVKPKQNNVSRKGEEEALHPFFVIRRTERSDRTGTKSISFDVDGDATGDGRGHQYNAACAKYTVRTDSAGEAQDSAWTQPRSVPLVPAIVRGS